MASEKVFEGVVHDLVPWLGGEKCKILVRVFIVGNNMYVRVLHTFSIPRTCLK